MRMYTKDLRVGDRLNENVFNQYGLHVLSKGALLKVEDITMLIAHQVDFVDIVPRQIEKQVLERVSQEVTILQNIQPKYDTAIAGVISLFQQALQEGRISEDLVNKSFEPLAEQFQSEQDVVSLLLTLNSRDEYTFQHSVQVGVISYYIAKWMGKPEAECLLVGKAGYLHDIGKCGIDPFILKKPAKLLQTEYEEIKKHTLLGYDIIIRSLHDNNEELALAALEHHERMNGAGYPRGIKGNEMHPISKIVSVADVYSAMISSRVYQNKRDLLFVLRELHHLSFGELDPVITHTFIKHLIPHFIGKKVTLHNGQSGKIVMINSSDFFRPLIQVDNQYIDLTRNRSMEVVQIHMH